MNDPINTGRIFRRCLLAVLFLCFMYWANAFDSWDRLTLYRQTLHLIHRTFDPSYYNAVWYAAKRPSMNYNGREGQAVRSVVIHYTGSTDEENMLYWLNDPRSAVSAHYVIDKDGNRYQLVPETMAAWHAGISGWNGYGSLNFSSIGIELFNNGHEEFTVAQMESLVILLRDIASRYHIVPQNFVGHSDIAFDRKTDPGPYFNWAWLAKQGFGLWPEVPLHLGGPELKRDDKGTAVARLQYRLARYGYGLPTTGMFDEATQNAVSAFQMHFRPARVNGRWDPDCEKRLTALLKLAGE